ncbi:hypothetical protein NL676_011795 [Syzygium grande]|nr:hypothetical protein NL676_011795 [Syzygium grande]
MVEQRLTEMVGKVDGNRHPQLSRGQLGGGAERLERGGRRRGTITRNVSEERGGRQELASGSNGEGRIDYGGTGG